MTVPVQVLDPATATAVRSICELLVPGCERIGAEVYIDALLARMPDEARAEALAAFDALAPAAAQGTSALGEHSLTPDFQLVRALACEAFYSDFVAPGAAGPGAWQEIDFTPPLAARLNKDWSWLTSTT